MLNCGMLHAQVKIIEDSTKFSLSIELKKPNGKIDRDAYVLMTVHNKTDQKFHMLHGGNGIIGRQLHSFFTVESVRVTGEFESYASGTCFYMMPGESYSIPAYGVYQEKVPIQVNFSGMSGTGFLGRKNITHRYLKIRALVEHFAVIGMRNKQTYFVNLTSNWLDISKEDFSEIEEK